MTWAVSATGTRDEVKAKLAEQFDNQSTIYTDQPQRDDIEAVKLRCMALIDIVDTDSQLSGSGTRIQVTASGTHWWSQPGPTHPYAAAFTFSIGRAAE